MKLALCIDDGGGMRFCGRRQSRDRFLLADLFSSVGTGRLFCEAASDSLLDGLAHTVISRTELSRLGGEDILFTECPPIAPLLPYADTLILYRWNREYPRDESLDISLTEFTFVRRDEFVGSSHERITKEIYSL